MLFITFIAYGAIRQAQLLNGIHNFKWKLSSPFHENSFFGGKKHPENFANNTFSIILSLPPPHTSYKFISFPVNASQQITLNLYLVVLT